jgi:hypothetical protein
MYLFPNDPTALALMLTTGWVAVAGLVLALTRH